MTERRKEQRWPAYLGGRIVFDDRQSTADCLIRSTSPCGARLELGQAGLLPDEFSLQIPSKSREMRVRTRWRRFRLVGVEAVPEHQAAAIDLEQARQLGRLKALNGQLTRRVVELTDAPL